jgi:uncharacterized membrane protein YeaQ/YmgE (transglycosylase-associated protein family)
MLQRNKYLAAPSLDDRPPPTDRRGRKPYGAAPRRRKARTEFGSRSENQGEWMGVETLIVWLIVGAIAGWLAGMVVRGGGFGLVGDIIVGIVGAFIAGWLLPRLHIDLGGGLIAAIIDAFIGAVILLIILRLIKRA